METETYDDTRKPNGGVFWIGVSAGIVAMLIAGWYFANRKEKPPITTANNVTCAPIPEGMAWKAGQLVPLAVKNDNPVAACAMPPVEKTAPATKTGDWTDPVEAQFAPVGLGWMALDLNTSDAGDESVDVVGTAPNRDLKAIGFETASTAIRQADDGVHSDIAINNEINIQRGRPGWANNMSVALKGLGFDWVDLSVRGPVATISGTAPDEAARNSAFEFASAAIKRNPDSALQINRIINGISVEGANNDAASALVELSNSDADTLSAEACQSAFSQTMQGRNIQFQIGQANISDESALLLNALSGIATLCVNENGHNVEIGGHTDATGNSAQNLRLSESRAVSVRDYLIRLGVDGTGLNAVGYGQTKPLDTAMTPEAHSKNRRTEFKILGD